MDLPSLENSPSLGKPSLIYSTLGKLPKPAEGLPLNPINAVIKEPYRFMGPFNDLSGDNDPTPRDQTDAIARRHDYRYAKAHSSNPQGMTEAFADELMIKDLSAHRKTGNYKDLTERVSSKLALDLIKSKYKFGKRFG